MSGQLALSVGIPTRNEAENNPELILRLNQRLDVAAELVFVDDSSDTRRQLGGGRALGVQDRGQQPVACLLTRAAQVVQAVVDDPHRHPLCLGWLWPSSLRQEPSANTSTTSRYERASLIVSSNKPFSAWAEIFGDAVAVAAMVDRLVHHAEIVSLKGDSYRLKDRRREVDAAG